MNIFSEIYGAYFRIAAKIMKSAAVSEKEVNTLIQEEGFRDSVLFLPQKLIPQSDGSDWGLLRKNADGNLSPITKNSPPAVMTKIQKSWLKSKLSDPKMRLFLDDDAIAAMEEKLGDTAPLYKQEDFRYTDIFTDGDSFTATAYRENFRRILSAVKSGQILEIEFISGHNRRIRQKFLPLKIEYSQKNDKFRVYCHTVQNGRLSGSGIINIGRIQSIAETGRYWKNQISMEKYFLSRKCKEPAVIRVTTERNAVERFFMEFASYEKRTERDLETGNCTVKIWYDKQDETELLIRLLSFGPVIEILGPADFRRQAAERVKRQWEMIGEQNA